MDGPSFSSLLDLKDETLGSVKTIPSIQLKSGRQQSIEYSFLFFPDDASISFFWSSSQSQTVKLFSDPDSEQQILWACIWPVNVINNLWTAPLHFSMINLNVIFQPLVCRLCVLLSTYSSSGMRIWAELSGLLSSEPRLARMMEAWIKWEQITSKLSDLVQIHSHLYILPATVLDFLSFIHLLNFINLNPFWKAL